ncbi:hypothetical protein [Shimia biformata]|uniref:hypothetical protein n=1 Tax=Shimia biformata TaxID=1294299 RepID=UPI00194F4E44|nr:hypothetical protein [Shimia biformata]
MMRLFALLVLLASPALAQSPMSAEEFDRYTRGKTLFYAADGTRYGVERYFPDRRVRWSFLDGKCKEGVWYEDAGDICFVYEDNPVPQCWVFYSESGGLRAEFRDGQSAGVLYEIASDEDEMLCLGPEVGV